MQTRLIAVRSPLYLLSRKHLRVVIPKHLSHDFSDEPPIVRVLMGVGSEEDMQLSAHTSASAREWQEALMRCDALEIELVAGRSHRVRLREES